ncbi:hypothetical protein BRADI_3g44503v3 [Brachypodium distachyon]|uniref:Uncharacterized protein n=1 Tax=Brachypodium distachyon TaxID=15368 RepID=A0A0Q3M553_BRADI|nr:hypothetical protein BRADI_3g44503v3 [Brachypodium distachyon]
MKLYTSFKKGGKWQRAQDGAGWLRSQQDHRHHRLLWVHVGESNLNAETLMLTCKSTRIVSISSMLLDHMLLSSEGSEACFFEIAAIVLSMQNTAKTGKQGILRRMLVDAHGK